ncbi:MAG TPA: hypothetical protein VGI23_06180 [Steroidobacteraceae bacterium]
MEPGSEQVTRRWVINLCSLAAPMVIPQPRAPRLTRFSFFLHHYQQEGRRQYRLLMGYFDSVAEADKWLATLQKIYPHAVVSEAPHSQPDLLTNTQALRILQLGQVASVPGDAGRLSEITSRTSPGGHAREVQSKQPAPLGKSNPIGAALVDTLKELRVSEFNMGGADDPDSTGVRHLRVEVQKRTGARRRIGLLSRK